MPCGNIPPRLSTSSYCAAWIFSLHLQLEQVLTAWKHVSWARHLLETCSCLNNIDFVSLGVERSLQIWTCWNKLGHLSLWQTLSRRFGENSHFLSHSAPSQHFSTSPVNSPCPCANCISPWRPPWTWWRACQATTTRGDTWPPWCPRCYPRQWTPPV